jgi:anthranilate synthase/aminodeoxychorismate synthase-like glutamine amidotransferase
MILMIDNYDSFTYNLVQYLGQLGEEVLVRRNDEITLVEIEAMKPEAIFLSPGPCSPEQAGITCDVVRTFHTKIPIMGVCLEGPDHVAGDPDLPYEDPDHGGLPGPPGRPP